MAAFAQESTSEAPGSEAAPAGESNDASKDQPKARLVTESEEVAPADVADPEQIKAEEERFQARIKGLEQKIHGLKEDIFKSKSKLTLLNEAVTGNLTTTAQLVIMHKNELGDVFRVVERHYFLDGIPLLQDRDEEGTSLTEEKERVVFNQPIVEGNHILSVKLVLQGDSGILSYVEAYKFTVSARHRFEALPGKVTKVDSIAFEKGNVTTKLEDKAAIQFKETSSRDQIAPGGGGGEK
jgi:hypothetical protein